MMKIVTVFVLLCAVVCCSSVEAKSKKFKSIVRRNPKKDDSLRASMKFPDAFGYEPRKKSSK